MKKLFIILSILIIALQINSTVQVTQSPSQANITANRILKVLTFEMIPDDVLENESTVIHFTIKNAGNENVTYNTTVVVIDSNETVSITNNSILLPGETSEVFRIYNTSKLVAGVHNLTLYINSTSTINFSPINNNYYTVNLTIQVNTTIVTGGGGSGSSGNGGSSGSSGSGSSGSSGSTSPNEIPIVIPPKDLHQISTKNYDNIQYSEGTMETGFQLDYDAKRTFRDNELKINNLPPNWNYQIIRVGETTFKMKIIPGGQSQNYGVQSIELELGTNNHFAILTMNLIPTRDTAILRTIQVPKGDNSTVKLDVVYKKVDATLVDVIETIPKDFANTTDDLNFRVKPIILQKDPQVKWGLYFKTSGIQLLEYNTLKTTGFVYENFGSVIGQFYNQVEIITTSKNEPIDFEIFTPTSIKPGETKKVLMTVTNSIEEEINATVDITMVSNCISPDTPENIVIKPRTKQNYEFAITCDIDSEEGEYTGTIIITTQQTTNKKPFQFIITTKEGNTYSFTTIGIIILIIATLAIAFIALRIRRKRHVKLDDWVNK